MLIQPSSFFQNRMCVYLCDFAGQTYVFKNKSQYIYIYIYINFKSAFEKNNDLKM